MELEQLQRAIEAILFAAGERLEISRLAAVLEIDEADVEAAADALADQLAFDRRGIRILKLDKGYQMVSSGEMADYITKALETRKPPKLSSSQLETLTIIAYYQPATKAMVEQIRGVDSAYSVAALLNKKLIEEAGRLNVPGRPIQYKTTPDFLRTFGISSLEELPPIDKIAFGEPVELIPENSGEGRLMGWLITVGILILLAILPLGVSVKYNSQGPMVKVILGPVRFMVFPRKKRAPKKEEKKEKAKTKEQPQSAPQNPPAPPATKEKKEPEEKGGSFLDFLPLVQLVFRFLSDFRRKLRLNHLELKLIMAGGDPANLAINYGRAWAAVGNLMPQLERIFVIKKRDVEVECDFTASETLVIARLDLSITLGRLLQLVFVYAIRALKEYLTIQKKRKGGAAK